MFRHRARGKETRSAVAPSWVTAPAITFAQAASPVTYSVGTATGNPEPVLTYALWLDGVAKGISYVPLESDIGKLIELRASASNGFGGVITASSAAAAVNPQAPLAPSWGSVPVVTRAQVGMTITHSLGTVYGYPSPSTSYVITLDGVVVAANYIVVSGDVGKLVAVTGTATNASGSVSALSNSVAVVSVLYLPKLPVNLRLVSANDTTFTVTCDPGVINATNGPTSGYEFMWAPTKTLAFTGSSGVIGENTYTFTGMSPNTIYEARVRASNAAGTTGWINLGTVWTEPGVGMARVMWLQRRDANNVPITTDSFCVYGSQDELADPPLLFTLSPGQYSQLPAKNQEIVYYKDLSGLAAGTWYFSVSTIDAAGNESDRSLPEKRTLT